MVVAPEEVFKSASALSKWFNSQWPFTSPISGVVICPACGSLISDEAVEAHYSWHVASIFPEEVRS